MVHRAGAFHVLCTAAVLAASLLGAAEEAEGDVINGIPVPPSPGDPEAHPGDRIWEPPRFTHYPAVIYEGESRNLAFRIPIPPDRARDRAAGLDRPDGAYHNPFGWSGGDSGTIGWVGDEALPITLPTDPELESVSGLLDLPTEAGRYRAELRFGPVVRTMELRVVPVRGPWPVADLRDGHPVDADGLPVVLLDRRRNADLERQWAALRGRLPRPDGPPLVVGDPLAAPEGDAWSRLDCERRPVGDVRHPHHALIHALASLPAPLPRTILWSPGNGPVEERLVMPEEERVLGALRNRLAHLGHLPRLVLLLPPLPADPVLQEAARERRDALRRSAQFVGWQVVDAAAHAGAPEQANRLAEGVFTRYPNGEHRAAVAAAVAEALVD